ncbi:hypothetical protein ACS0TY_033630 [Phlomoides rotata]
MFMQLEPFKEKTYSRDQIDKMYVEWVECIQREKISACIKVYWIILTDVNDNILERIDYVWFCYFGILEHIIFWWNRL